MRTFKEFLIESKQVGIVYHFTTIDKLEMMLNQHNPLELYSINMETISTTRNPLLPMFNNDFRKADVRIMLDGNKLSQNHKILPIAGLSDNETDVLNHGHNKYRVPRYKGEAEEAVFKVPLDIKPYIIDIHVLTNRYTMDKYRNEIEPKLKHFNIHYTYIKSYSLGHVPELHESVGKTDWEGFFVLGIFLQRINLSF